MKYDENCLPEGYRVRVTHISDSDHLRQVSLARGKFFCPARANAPGLTRWITVAVVRGPDGEFVAGGVSRCHHTDQPSRAKGRMIAVGRAVKKALELIPQSDDSLIRRLQECLQK